MDSLVSILIFLVVAIISGIAQKAKEAGTKPAGPRTIPPAEPMPLPPWLAEEVLSPQPLSPPEGEGHSLEESSVWLEGEGAQEEGGSLEGEGGELPDIAAELFTEETESPEWQVSFAEADRLTSGEEEEAARDARTPAQSADLAWDPSVEELEPDIIQAENWRRGKRWFGTRDDLIAAVLAAEVLGRPGGWRRNGTLRWQVPVRG